MAGCAPIRHTDGQTDKDQTCRQEDAAATVDFGFGFLPIRSYKENDIIPVLIGQQEGRGRQRAAGCVGGSMKEYEETKGNVCVDQREGRAMTMAEEVYLTSGLQDTLMCPTERSNFLPESDKAIKSIKQIKTTSRFASFEFIYMLVYNTEHNVCKRRACTSLRKSPAIQSNLRSECTDLYLQALCTAT